MCRRVVPRPVRSLVSLLPPLADRPTQLRVVRVLFPANAMPLLLAIRDSPRRCFVWIEVEGHIKDPALIAAVAELRHFTTSVHILGSFPRHSARQHVKTRWVPVSAAPLHCTTAVAHCGYRVAHAVCALVVATRTLNPNEELYAAASGGPDGPAAITGVAEPPPPLHRRSHSSTPTGAGLRAGGTPGVFGAGEGGEPEAAWQGPAKRQRASGDSQ
jgi:hypothetical protein